VLSVTVPRRTRVLATGGLVLAIACDRPCRVSAHGVLGPAGGRGRTALSAPPRTLGAGRATRVRLRVSARGIAIIRRALGRRRGLRAQVVVTAVGLGPTGGAAALPVRAAYHLTR
jgi:hypothetical protein